jgi:proteasome lid subunit RPN8/RPN11
MDILRDIPVGELYLKQHHWKTMLADVSGRAHEEACGLVAGLDETCTAVFPITNILHSQVRYRMDPEEQWEAFQEIEENRWKLVAFYHSHPFGLSELSPSDFAETTYPGVIYLLWFQTVNEWDCRGYRIVDRTAKQVSIHILDNDE